MLKLNVKPKSIVALVAVLFFIGFLWTNPVSAVEISNEQAEEMLDMIPDEMELDLKEVDYKKAGNLIENNVREIWKENNINNEELQIKATVNVYVNVELFYKVYLSIGYNEGTMFHTLASKDITVSFNNTNDKSAEEENDVKSLKFENPKYIEMSLDYLKQDGDIWDWYKEYMSDYYEKKVNDSSVKIETFVGAGTLEGVTLWTTEGGVFLNIFKNGKLYDVKEIGDIIIIPVINIPNTITKEKMNDYVISEISKSGVNKYWNNYAENIVDIIPGCDWDIDLPSIPNLYTIQVKSTPSNPLPDSIIIINKEETKEITSTDTTTNIKLETTTDVVPSNTKLVAEEVKTGKTYTIVEEALGNSVSKFVIYDINLMNNNAKIQPNGKVKISLPVPSGYDTSKITVYRVADDGTKTEYETKVENGYIIFETDHFSSYVVAEKGTSNEPAVAETKEETPASETTPAEEKPVSTPTRKKDDTPKTGNPSRNIVIYISAVAVIATVVIIKKHKKRV